MRKSILMASVCCVLLINGCSSGDSDNSDKQGQGIIGQFRGDAHNTGVYDTAGLTMLQGEKWSTKLEGTIHGSPVLAEGVLYIGSEEGTLFALDADKGTVKWQVPLTGKIRSSAAVIKDELYIMDDSSALYALDNEKGEVRWKMQLDNRMADDTSMDKWDYFIASPAADEDTLYIGSEGFSFYALNREDGSEKWKVKTDSAVHGKAVLTEDIVYFADLLGVVYALDRKTGKEIWKIDKSGMIQSSLAYKEGVLYYGSRDTKVYAIDAVSGKELWSYTSPGGSWVGSSAAASDKYVVIGASDSKMLHVFDRKNGSHKLDFTLGSRIFSSPAIVDNVAYFGSAFTDQEMNMDALFAVDLETGKAIWTFEGSKAPILSSPVVSEGIVYYASMDGYVYALH